MSFWDEVKYNAKKGADMAADAAGDLYEKGKIRGDIEKTRDELRKQQQKLGELYYAFARSNMNNQEELEECLNKVDELLGVLRQQNAQKYTTDGKVRCRVCGAYNDAGNEYCAFCGNCMSEEEE